jgi:hypothetical protein
MKRLISLFICLALPSFGVVIDGVKSDPTQDTVDNLLTKTNSWSNPPIYKADSITLNKNGTVFSVANWIPNNLTDLYTQFLVQQGATSRGLLDGPGYLFNDQNGILPELSTNQVFETRWYENSITNISAGSTNIVVPYLSLLDDGQYGSVYATGTALDNPTVSGAISIVLKFKNTWSTSTYRRLVDRWSGAGNGLVLYYSDNGGDDHGISFRANGNWVSWKTNLSVFNDGNWHTVICMADSTTEAIWWDGTNKTSTSVGGTVGAGSLNTFRIGLSEDPDYANADYSYLAVYSRVLTTPEIASIQSGESISSSGLCVEYLFQEGTGTTANDSSGNNLDLTLSGDPSWGTTTNTIVNYVYTTNSMSLTSTNKVLDFLPTSTWLSILASGTGLTTDDVQGYVSPDYGTNWYPASLVPSASIDLSNTLFQGTASYTNNVDSSNMVLKAVTTSNKVVKILGMWGPSN